LFFKLEEVITCPKARDLFSQREDFLRIPFERYK
jgi:hypothetical protein